MGLINKRTKVTREQLGRIIKDNDLVIQLQRVINNELFWRMGWNEDSDTLDIYHENDVVQQVGVEFYVRVRNTSGSTITNGQLCGLEVVADTVVGEVAPYISDGTINPIYITGIATEDILDGEQGRLTNPGLVRGIDTTGTPYGETWAVGDILYASPTVAGGLTNIHPNPPAWTTPCALVLAVDNEDGVIYSRPNIEQGFYYGCVSRNTTQVVAAINTAYVLNFDLVTGNGIGIGTPTSRITFPEPGLYSVAVIMHLQSTSAAAKDFYMWFRQNGVDVANSNVLVTLKDGNSFFNINRTILFSIAEGDYIEVGYAGTSTGISIKGDPATAFSPATPACCVTITQVQH